MSIKDFKRFTITTMMPICKNGGGGERKTFKGIKAVTVQEACDKVAAKIGGHHGALKVKRTS